MELKSLLVEGAVLQTGVVGCGEFGYGPSCAISLPGDINQLHSRHPLVTGILRRELPATEVAAGCRRGVG